MKKNRKRSIKQKVVALVIFVSMAGIFAVSLITLFSMDSMRKNIVKANTQLGNHVAKDAKETLSNQAKQNISALARSKSDYIEQRFEITERYVSQIADEMTRIYNESDYPNNMVEEPKKENDGIVSTQLMYSEKVLNRNLLDLELKKISNIDSILYQTVKQDEVVAAAYVATESGIVIMSDFTSSKKFEDGIKEPKPYEANLRPWYKKAKEENKLIFTDVVYDIHGGGLGIVCAKPFYKSEKIMGVAGVGSFLNDVNDLVMETEIGETGYVFLINQKGQVNISPKKSGEVAADPDNLTDLRKSSNKELASTADKMVNGESGITELTIDGKDVYLAYEPMKNLGWSFAVLIEAEEVLRPANESKASIVAMTKESSDGISEEIKELLFVLLGLLAVVLGIMVLVSMRWSDKLTVPIEKLVGEVKKIGEGDLEGNICIETGDEVETLANSFNKMTKELREYIANLTEITAEKERIGAELNVATKIQASMLPCIFPAFPDINEIDIYATMTPAKEVGGDFYDFFLVDEKHLAVIMADVSGKGVPAALFMVIAKTLIKNHTQLGKSPAEVFTAVNAQLCENNEAAMFVTAFMGVLDFSNGKFVYVNAGHNAPLIKKQDGKFEWLKARPGFVLAGMEGIKYKQAELTLQKGDVFFTYTDGVTEALNPDKNLYSDERLFDTLNKSIDKNLNVEELLNYIKKDIDFFAEGEEQADDITILGLEYKGGVNNA